MRDAVRTDLKDQADLIAISDATAPKSPGPVTTTWRRPTSLMSPATCSRSSALSPRSAACSLPPMTAAPVYAPMPSSPGTIGITASAAIPTSWAASSTSATRPSKSSAWALAISLEPKRERSPTSFCRSNMNSLATQDGVMWHHAFLMLKPGVNPATALEPLRQASLRRQPRLRGRLLHMLPWRSPRPTIDRLLNKQLVFTPAGAGISDLQKDYRRFTRHPRSAGRSRPAYRLRQRRQHDDRPGRRPRPGDGSPHLDRRRPSPPRPAHPVRRALCSPCFASVLGAFFAAWSAPFVLSLVNPPDNPARLALPADWRVLLFGLRAHCPRGSPAWFASCSPRLCRPARRRAQRWGGSPLATPPHAWSHRSSGRFLFPRPLSVFALRRILPAPAEPPPRFLHGPSAPARNRCRQRPAPRRLESNSRSAPCRSAASTR